MTLAEITHRVGVTMFGDSATRLRVANACVFQNESSQRADLLNPNSAQTELIALMDWLQKKGVRIECTAIRNDHGFDGDLSPDGEGTHSHGFGLDFWPLSSSRAGDYMPPDTHDFREVLVLLAQAPFHMQTGLGGSASLPANFTAAGPTAFQDSVTQDHVHVGVRR